MGEPSEGHGSDDGGDGGGPTERFAQLATAGQAELADHLDEAMLLIAAHARPDLDVASYLGVIDGLAFGVDAATADSVISHLFGEVGFAGDSETYYDARNSYLDQVIERRRGIPITLAVLAMEVGRRVGVDFVPIGMPGHFLLEADGALRDPFESGRRLTLAECEQRFHSIHGPATPFHPSLLEPVGPHAILSRVLANLRQIHLMERDSVALEWVLRLRGLLPGTTLEERAERAGVLAALGRFDRAADVLDDLAPIADEERGTQLRAKARQLRARLN